MLNIIRIAKIVALVAFILPWAAVSCSNPMTGNIDIATASGIEFVQGKMTPNKDAQKQMSGSINAQFGVSSAAGAGASAEPSPDQKVPDTGLSFLTIAGAIVIVVGLLLSLVTKGKSAGRNALITSLVAAALLFGGMFMWKDAMKKQITASEGGGASASSPLGGGAGANPFGAQGGNPFGGSDMAGMGAGMIDGMLQERFGYWIAIGALVVAAGAGAIGMAGGASALNRSTPPTA